MVDFPDTLKSSMALVCAALTDGQLDRARQGAEAAADPRQSAQLTALVEVLEFEKVDDRRCLGLGPGPLSERALQRAFRCAINHAADT
jgi:hypothetical protein